MRIKEEIKEWIDKSEEDYKSALLLHGKGLSDSVCFHCEQCIQKYLKALLIYHKIHFPKTHDLRELLKLLIDKTPDLEKIRDDLEVLNPYSVGFRYPGISAYEEEEKECITAMETARRALRQKLGLL